MAQATPILASPRRRGSFNARSSVPLLWLSACAAVWEPINEKAPAIHWPDAPDAVSDVNVFVGTGGPGYRVGSSTPAATTPFGLVKLGPDSALDWGGIGAQHCSGYFYDDTHIDGFSHLHLHGTGVPDYGNILVMPLLASDGAADGSGLDATMRGPDQWRTGFSHDNEAAAVGYYAVTLDNGVLAELTASPRAGFHRYTFPAGEPGMLVFDLEHVLGGGGSEGEVTVDAGAGTLSGSMLSSGSFTDGYGGFRVYFYAVVEGGFTEWGSWAEGADVGAWVIPNGQTADLRVGVSLVSLAGAEANLEAEDVGDFEAQVDAAQALWRTPLSQFELLDATTEERVLFYTSAYHLLQMPTNQTDLDGNYIGFDRAAHNTADTDQDGTGTGDFYSDMSLWDTYRTANPAYILFYPDYARDFAQSLVTMSLQGTALPRWPAASGESGCMLGNPADIVLAETAIKGITGWDEDAGFESAVALALGELTGTPDDPPSPADLERYGYLPSDLYGASVAWTQEVAWADNAIANWAGHRGDLDTAAHFAWRSRFWRNQWDPTERFFHGRRSDGTFDEMPGEFAWAEEYVEGDAWQYLWLAAQPAELAEVMGGEEAARTRLTEFFAGAKAEGLIVGPAAYYWHGNEPDLHAAFLFTMWGDPDGTLLWQRWIEDERYANAPDGLAGNDDAGTLGAWYMFSALGFYPLSGTDLYIIAVPRYAAARFAVEGGWFTVAREGDGGHIVGVELNGVPVTRPYLHHAELTANGSLVVHLE
ncbi:MAG: glycoside hydrolase family 92 protein [Myxococcales bacterium]|nr:glycoside hydrolase family 92 protein [Myxococcales bacterium]